MARPPNADGQRTRQAILDAALGTLRRQGLLRHQPARRRPRRRRARERALQLLSRQGSALRGAARRRIGAQERAAVGASRGAGRRRPRACSNGWPSSSLDRFVAAAAAAALSHPDVRRHAPRARRPHQPARADGQQPAAAPGAHAAPRSTPGVLRDVDPELLVMQFFGPLLFWRQLHAIGATTAHIRNRRAFARAHVDQFLNGAAAAPSVGRGRASARTRTRVQRIVMTSARSARHRSIAPLSPDRSDRLCAGARRRGAAAPAAPNASPRPPRPASAEALAVTTAAVVAAAGDPLHSRVGHARRAGRSGSRRRSRRPRHRDADRARQPRGAAAPR